MIFCFILLVSIGSMGIYGYLYVEGIASDVDLNAIGKTATGPRRKLPRGVLIDSWAGASVADGQDSPEFPKQASAGSRNGQHFAGPGNERIKNRGQFKAQLRTAAGTRANILFHGAQVRRPILAVSDSTRNGNLLAFDKDESIIIRKDSLEGQAIRRIIKNAQKKIPLDLVGGVYELPVWVDSDQAEASPFARQGTQP